MFATRTICAGMIAGLILERVIFETYLLEFIAFRLIPVICPERSAKPETDIVQLSFAHLSVGQAWANDELEARQGHARCFSCSLSSTMSD